MSPPAVASCNGLSNPDFIIPGRLLAIPDVFVSLPAGPTCSGQCITSGPPLTIEYSCVALHSVAYDGTLYFVSLDCGANMHRVAECNDMTNLNLIIVGESLCIP